MISGSPTDIRTVWDAIARNAATCVAGSAHLSFALTAGWTRLPAIRRSVRTSLTALNRHSRAAPGETIRRAEPSWIESSFTFPIFRRLPSSLPPPRGNGEREACWPCHCCTSSSRWGSSASRETSSDPFHLSTSRCSRPSPIRRSSRSRTCGCSPSYKKRIAHSPRRTRGLSNHWSNRRPRPKFFASSPDRRPTYNRCSIRCYRVPFGFSADSAELSFCTTVARYILAPSRAAAPNLAPRTGSGRSTRSRSIRIHPSAGQSSNAG